MPSELHEILLDLFRNRPELAVLSAIAHGRRADYQLAARIARAAIAACVDLDPQRAVLYFDVVMSHLSDAARARLQVMDPSTYEYKSEFAKHYLAQGRDQGRAEGRDQGRAEGRDQGRVEGEAMLLSRQLTLKFGPLAPTTSERLRTASTAELERWAERILTATSLDELFR